MATTPSSRPDASARRYPELPPRNWTDEQAQAWLKSVEEFRARIVARRGELFTKEEIDELLQAVKEGRD